MAFAGTSYYAATNGSSGNTGLSSDSPWPLGYAIANAGASNTIIVMPGIYQQADQFRVSTSWMTIRSQTKWGAWLVNSPSHGIQISVTDGSVNGLTLDGLVISNAMHAAVSLLSGTNHTVRNCWILRTGQFASSTGQDEAGINAYAACRNSIYENNVVEWNGSSSFDPGIYVNGTNVVVRNNVIRYNHGYGCQIADSDSAHMINNCWFYNNLVYGNRSQPDDDDYGCQFIFYSHNTGQPQTNYMFGNTIITTNGGHAVLFQDVTVMCTNNILISTGSGIVSWASTVYADYNLANSPLAFAGPHDVITNYFGFVNPNNGLYWLKSDSPARWKALAGAAGPVSFFGNSQGSVFDIGAFQYNAAYASDSRSLDPSPANPDYWANSAGTNGGTASITVTPINQSVPDVDPISPGLQVYSNSVVEYSGSASDPGGLPLTWQWIYAVNGGPEVVIRSGTGTVAGVSFDYASSTAGDTYVWKLRVSNGSATAETTLTVGVEAPPLPPGSLTFQASSGTLSSPFVATDSYIYQPVETSVTSGGQAVFNFTVTNAGSYGIQALVNAPNTGANSFYINIDGQPQNPTMIWDVPITTGFEQRIVGWRGNGTDTNDQFVRKIFTLSAGTHQLVIVGREANTQLAQLSIVAVPPPPQNLRIVALP